MAPTLADRAKSATAGFFVIVVGVLVALAADRWNQNRLDRGLEAEYTESLLSDLLEDSVMLASESAEGRRRGERASVILATIRGESISEDEVALLFGDEGSRSLVEVLGESAQPLHSSSTFEELESTGNIRLISNRELRRALYRYYSEVSFLRERALYLQGVDRDPASLFVRSLGDVVPRFSPASVSEIAEAPEAESVFVAVLRYHEVRGRYLDQWQQHLTATLAILRSGRTVADPDS